MNVFLTSDTHYGAERTRQFSHRPFGDTHEMDEHIMNLHNMDASKNDLVYHLGDFGNYEMVKHLNGRIILICGNYEQTDIDTNFKGDFISFRKYLLELGFFNVIRYSTWLNDIYLTHRPSNCYQNMFNCFGHIHGAQKIKKFGLNVGVDCHHFHLVSFDHVKQQRIEIKEHYDEDVFM